MIHWDWVCGAITVIGIEMTGRKMWQGWAVGLGNQAFWLLLIFTRELWGLLPLTIVLTVLYAKYLVKWYREGKALREIGATEEPE